MSERIVVVDSSAVVAMQAREHDSAWFTSTLTQFDAAVMSAGSYQEALLVLSRRAPHGAMTDVAQAAEAVTSEIAKEQITIFDVDEELALLGAIGSLRFGSKPARLNYGDGFAYALAKRLDAPILCKGDDFIHTDIEVLRPPTV